MKAKIVEAKGKGFAPFKIEIDVETEEEARLLFHIFNYNGDLRSLIFRDKTYDMENLYDYAGTKENLITTKIHEDIARKTNIYK